MVLQKSGVDITNSILFLLISLGQLVWPRSNHQKQFVQTTTWSASPPALMAPQASDSADKHDPRVASKRMPPCADKKGDSWRGTDWYEEQSGGMMQIFDRC